MPSYTLFYRYTNNAHKNSLRTQKHMTDLKSFMAVKAGARTNKNMNSKTVFIVMAFTMQPLCFTDKSIWGLQHQNKAVTEAYDLLWGFVV